MFNVKNNNVYYYNHKLFNGELSYIIIPLIILVILFYNNIIQYLSPLMISTSIFGIINSYYKTKKYNKIFFIIYGIIFDIVGLYPFINIEKYFSFNLITYLFGLITLLIIYFYPYWNYILTKKDAIILIVLVYIIYTIYHIINM